MIPLQLKLSNFLSYGPQTQTINFEPYHLLCLSGKNGHGKSALLDAITWVLWGQARKTGGTLKADEGLLRLGQSNMKVSLDFLCKNQRYRVTREFTKTDKKAHATLNFGITRGDNKNDFMPLSEKTSRETQQKIIDTLGLNYNSFINSVFLRQGQSNEFSKKSAKERKEILATILGLNRYENLKKQAMEKIRDCSNNKEQCTNRLTQITEELQQKSTVEATLTTISKKIIELTTEKRTVQATIKKYAAKKELLAKQQSETVILKFKLKQTSETIEHQLTTLRTIVQEWRSICKKQREQKNSASSPFQKEQLEKLNRELETKHTKQLKLKEHLFILKEERSTLQQKLHIVYAEQLQKFTNTYQKELFASETIKNKLTELGKQLQEKIVTVQTLEKETISLTASIKQFKKINEHIKLTKKSFERRKTYYYHFIERGNRLAADLKKLQQKKLLGETIEDPSCPLCEQALSNARKKFLYNKFTHQEHFFTHQHNRLKQVILELKATMVKQHNQLEQLQQQQTQKTRLTDQKTAAEKQLETVECSLSDLTKQNTYLLNEQKALMQAVLISNKILNEHQKQNKSYYTKNSKFKELEKHLKETTEQLETNAYDQENHETVKKKLLEIQKHHAEAAELLHQLSLQEQRKQQVHNLIVATKTLKQEQTKLSVNLKRHANCAKETNKLREEHETLTAKLTTLLDAKEELLQKKGALEQQIKLFEKREFEQKQYQKQIKEHENNLEDYQTIAQALGKNGIQALLIEIAILRAKSILNASPPEKSS